MAGGAGDSRAAWAVPRDVTPQTPPPDARDVTAGPRRPALPSRFPRGTTPWDRKSREAEADCWVCVRPAGSRPIPTPSPGAVASSAFLS